MLMISILDYERKPGPEARWKHVQIGSALSFVIAPASHQKTIRESRLDDRRPAKVLVAVPTCDRPDDLARMLDSLAACAEPAGARCSVLVVENGSRLPAKPMSLRAGRYSAPPVCMIVEERKGIPYARNAALDYALSGDFDLLAFSDDDETVEAGWLVNLIDGLKNGAADLAGGPVFAQPPPESLQAWPAFLMRGYERWYQVRQARNEAQLRRGNQDRITILTNNWLLDLNFVRRTGLRFSDAFRISGGSDAHFCSELRRLGGTTVWCQDALVRETVLPERLYRSLHFLYRGAQQRINHIERNARAQSCRAVCIAILLLLADFLATASCPGLVSSPLAGPYAFFDGDALNCGRAFGGRHGRVWRPLRPLQDPRLIGFPISTRPFAQATARSSRPAM